MKQRIAVLGAGPMGLAVAYQLAKDGHEPVVFEADDRVGGMTATFDFNGLEIERYYHFHCISDHAFLTLLDELRIQDKMHWVETKMGYWYQNKLQAWGNPLALLSFKGLGWVAKFRYGLHAFLSTKRDDWKPLDHVEASDWIRRWVGAEAYEVLWRRLFDYKFYDHVGNLSAAWIWSRIRRIGRSRYSLFREKLGYRLFGVPSARMVHSLGDRRTRLWFLRWRNVPYHSPFRYYYILRNSLLMQRRSYMPIKWRIAELIRCCRVICFYSLFGSQRLACLWMMMRGIVDGFRGVTGPMKP